MGYVSEVLADSPGGYHRLGESSGTTVVARVGTDLTYFATPTLGVTGALTPSGDTNTAVTFDNASSEFIEIPLPQPWSSVVDVFTVELWVKRGDTGRAQSIAYNGGGNFDVCFDVSDFVRMDQAATIGGVVTSSVAITDTTTWHHIVVTKDGATTKLYIDGVDRTGSTTAATFTTGGAYRLAHGNQGFFKGTLDEVALYSTALSAGRVFAHYAAGVTMTGNFERGINGATIAIGDTGSATPWSFASGATAYSSTHVAHGSLAARLDGATTNSYTYWETPGPVDSYFRFYLYATAFPTVTTTWIVVSSFGLRVRVDSAGKIIVYDSAANVILTFATAIALNQWVRIEGHLNTTTKLTEVRLFNSAESTSPTETQGNTSGIYPSPMTRIYFGTASTDAFSNWGSDIWLDDIVANAPDWVGPVEPQALSMLAHVSGHSVW